MDETICEHGHGSLGEATVNADGITSCCGVYTSIFTDDGSEYCRCCYGTVYFDGSRPS
jgi:hypothetical protein